MTACGTKPTRRILTFAPVVNTKAARKGHRPIFTPAAMALFASLDPDALDTIVELAWVISPRRRQLKADADAAAGGWDLGHVPQPEDIYAPESRQAIRLDNDKRSPGVCREGPGQCEASTRSLALTPAGERLVGRLAALLVRATQRGSPAHLATVERSAAWLVAMLEAIEQVGATSERRRRELEMRDAAAIRRRQAAAVAHRGDSESQAGRRTDEVLLLESRSGRVTQVYLAPP